MEYALQNSDEGLPDFGEISEGQRRFVQLALIEHALEQIVHAAVKGSGIRIGKGAARGFHHIGKHDDCSFLRLRSGSRIMVSLLAD